MRRVPKGSPAMFAGIVGEIVTAFRRSTEAAAEPIAAQFMVAFGNAAGRGPTIYSGETPHRMNQNLLIVGRTAKARKGDGKNVAVRVLERADPEWAMRCNASGLSSGEGLIFHVRDAMEKADKKGVKTVVDEGVHDKRLLVVETEFSSTLKMFKREGNTLSAVLRDAWDGKTVLRTMTKNAPTQATNAHISIIGHTTPADLHEHLAEVDVANGLANRFLIVLTERAQLLPVLERVPEHVLDRLGERVRYALEAARTVAELRLDADAEDEWRAIYPKLSGEIPGLVGAVLGRAEPHVLRLAGLYALLDGEEVIRTEHLDSGLAFWDVVDESARMIFAGRTGNALADRARDSVVPGESVSMDDLYDRLGRHTPAARLRDALRLLGELGEFRAGTEATGGRPRQVVTRRPEGGWIEATDPEPEAAHA